MRLLCLDKSDASAWKAGETNLQTYGARASALLMLMLLCILRVCHLYMDGLVQRGRQRYRGDVEGRAAPFCGATRVSTWTSMVAACQGREGIGSRRHDLAATETRITSSVIN
jgi:hypothetical protein